MNRFFIIGNPRSGTTLFRLMLNKNSKVVVPPEAGFLVWLYNNHYEEIMNNNYIFFLERLKNTSKIENWNIDYDKLEKYLILRKPSTYQEAINCVYQFYSSDVLKKEVEFYGDKNNFYLNHIDLISSLYKNSKFIHILRDGRSVAASYKNLMKKNIISKYAPKLPTAIEDIANEWCSNISKIESSFKKLKKPRKITIRYEDLILYPNKTLCMVCDFLGVDFEIKMLDFYTTTEQEGLEPKSFYLWKNKNLQPIDIKEVYRYRELENFEINNFERVSGSLLRKYGYLVSIRGTI